MPGALPASCQQHTSYLSLSQSSMTSSEHDDTISDFSASPGGYSPSYSSCLSHKLSPLTFERNVSQDTLSLYPPSDCPTNSPNSINFSFSSEIGDNIQETTHFCSPLTEIAPHNFDDNPLQDTLLDQRGHIPRVLNTSGNYSPEFYPNSLLLSQPDGKNNWTLSLDPSISQPVTVSESVESESLLSSCVSDKAISITIPSVTSTPKHNASLSLREPSSRDDITKFNASSDTSMIVSSTSSVQQQRQGGGSSSVRFNAGNSNDLPHGFVSHRQPPLDGFLDPQQPSRSKKLVKKSKNIFGRFKKLFSPKGTASEDIHDHAHTAHSPESSYITAMPSVSERRLFPSYQRYRLSKSTMSLTPSFGQSFGPSLADDKVDEKNTYEYHARPKTLKEIKSQRRFSLPLAFGTSSRVTPPTKRKVTTSFSRSHPRPMSIYIASQTETLDFAP
jgi:hypothetical protein